MPASYNRSRFTACLAAFCALLILAFASGCSSPHSGGRVASSDSKTPSTPGMQGQSEFFDGKLLVVASLGHGFHLRPGQIRHYDDAGSRDDDGSGEFDLLDSNDNEDDANQNYTPRVGDTKLPPVALRLRVTNQTQQPVDVVFLECDSSLGNFVVYPEKITIAPGKTGAPDPMTSLLGIDGGEIPLTIGLQLGDAKETKIITLRAVETAPAPAPSALAPAQ